MSWRIFDEQGHYIPEAIELMAPIEDAYRKALSTDVDLSDFFTAAVSRLCLVTSEFRVRRALNIMKLGGRDK